MLNGKSKFLRRSDRPRIFRIGRQAAL